MAGEVENIAISAFNKVVVEVEAELGNYSLEHLKLKIVFVPENNFYLT